MGNDGARALWKDMQVKPTVIGRPYGSGEDTSEAAYVGDLTLGLLLFMQFFLNYFLFGLHVLGHHSH